MITNSANKDNRSVQICNNQHPLETKLAVIIAFFAFALYAQSTSFDYALDDGPAVTQNKLVQEGLKGIPTLLKTDYWFGYSEKSRGPQYRPASLVMLALEWQFFPRDSHISHFINVILYAITCLLLFILLLRLVNDNNLIFAFVCVLLYTAHPIHTEVVNNIKSRDELLCFLFGVVSILFFLKYYSKNSIPSFILGNVFYFLSFTSKETAISFLVVIPLLLFVFKETNYKKLAGIALSLAAVTAVYLFIRYRVVESIQVHQIPVFDNTLIGAEKYSSQMATAFYILLRYLSLLIFPHPLSCDYSFAQIPFQTFNSPLAIFALAVYIALGVYAVIKIRKKDVLAFAILFFLIMLFPVSNLLFLIGSTMAERFLYIPSLGFSIALSLLIIKCINAKNTDLQVASLKQFLSQHRSILIIVFIITAIYSTKTVARSQDWKDDLSLFSHDVKVSDNSVRTHYNFGMAILRCTYYRETNIQKKQESLERLINEFERSLSIFPAYHPAQKSLGYVYLMNRQYEKSITQLDQYLLSDQTDAGVYNNKGAALMGIDNYEEALPAFQKAIELEPRDTSVYKNIGRCNVFLRQYKEAIVNFNRCIELDSTDSESYRFIGLVYQFMGESAKGKQFIERAQRMKLPK